MYEFNAKVLEWRIPDTYTRVSITTNHPFMEFQLQLFEGLNKMVSDLKEQLAKAASSSNTTTNN